MSDSSLVPELEREPRPVRMQLLRIIPVVLVLGLLIHFVLPRLGSVADSIDALHTLKPWAIVLAVLFEIFSYIATGSCCSPWCI